MAKHFHAQNQEPPAFERTQETAQFLRELMELNQTQDKAALETLKALEECSLLYQDEGKHNTAREKACSDPTN